MKAKVAILAIFIIRENRLLAKTMIQRKSVYNDKRVTPTR